MRTFVIEDCPASDRCRNCAFMLHRRIEVGKRLTSFFHFTGQPIQSTEALKLFHVSKSSCFEAPPQDGERLVTLRRVGNVGLVGLIFHIPAGSHVEFPAVQLLTTSRLVGTEPSGRDWPVPNCYSSSN